MLSRGLPLPALALLALALALALPIRAAPGQERLPAFSATGGAGLIAMPSAFMAPQGWAWFGASGGPPPGYSHGFAGFQPLPWLETTLRYSDFAAGGEGGFGFAAADVKIRLLEESARLPQIAVGARGLFGEGVLAGEYLALGKHFRWGEATVGLGWGRFAGSGLAPNPLRLLGEHVARDRPSRREPGAAGFDDLFAGEDLGLFGGVSLRTPVPDLRLQLEYASDDFGFERDLDPDFRAPLPVDVGLVWRPVEGLQLGAAFERGERAVLRLAFGFRPGALPLSVPPDDPPPLRTRDRAPADAGPGEIAEALAEAGARPVAVTVDGARAGAWIDADPRRPAALQIGRAARALAASAPADVAAFDIALGHRGFDLTRASLARGDLERAGRFAGSAEEIRRDATIARAEAPPEGAAVGLGLRADLWAELRGELGLQAPEAEALTRWSLLAEAEVRHRSGLVLGAASRFALADTLVAPDFEERLVIPVRSDRVLFAEGPVARLERGYVGWRWRVREDVFAETAVGYLEEAYAGVRSEVLWRPFGSRFALGLDSVQAVRRDPASQWQLLPISAETVHVNLFWRPPGTGLDLQLSAGRFLAGDPGGELRAWRDFGNGVRLEVRATVTDAAEGDDPFTGGVELVIPLQRALTALPRSRARFALTPLLRDSGRRLDWPDDLHALTDPAGFEAVAGSWHRLLD